MRRLSTVFAALCAAFVSFACSSSDFYRARVESTGTASAQAMRVKDGVEKPVTARYKVEGYGIATAQSVKPYLTLDGAWSPDVSEAASAQHEPDAVLIRPLPPEASTPRAIRTTLDGKPALLIPLQTAPVAASAGGECLAGPDGLCDITDAPGAASEVPCPTPAVVAAPLPDVSLLSGRPCGTPVYVGCDGTPGGNRPTPGGTMKQIAPGTGWPCSADVAGDPVLSALAVPPGFVMHVGECFVKFLKCAVTPPDLGNANK